jgi:hypothetical protein
METAEVTKIHKYRAMREELYLRYPGYQVRQLNFIIGIQGTISSQVHLVPKYFFIQIIFEKTCVKTRWIRGIGR